jgi:hypothetical protein
MPSKTELPNPKNADYQIKDSLIVRLAVPVNKRDDYNAPLYQLGLTLKDNFMLSNKQKGNLLEILQKNDLISYKSNYFRTLDEAEKVGKYEEVEKNMLASLDGVFWEIESNSNLQAQAIVSAADLSGQSLSFLDRVAITACLFNAASLACKKGKQFFSSPYNENDLKGVAKFEQLEEKIYAETRSNTQVLKDSGLMTSDELEGIDNSTLEELRQSEIYDKLIASHFVITSRAHTTVEIFKELQEVLHSGYAMGVRSENKAYKRLSGEEE